jgi:short-subunit dehydrogenase
MMRTGSHVHATFKGDHAAEFRWFDRSRKIPFASISAERAARKIVHACARGKRVVVMPFTAYLIIAANAVFPNLMARIMKVFNGGLPPQVSQSGDEPTTGAQIRPKQ